MFVLYWCSSTALNMFKYFKPPFFVNKTTINTLPLNWQKSKGVMEFFPSILHVRQICKTLKYVSYGAALGRASRGSIGWIFHGSNCATDHYCGISHSGNLYFSAYFLIFSTYFPRDCTLVVLQPSSGTKISNNREESNTLLARLAVRSVVNFAFCNI